MQCRVRRFQRHAEKHCDIPTAVPGLRQPSLGIEPLRRPATLEDGFWVVDDLTILVAGARLVQIDIRASRFELVKLQTELTIP